jgi:hypothetical protein
MSTTVLNTKQLQQGTCNVDLQLAFVFPGWASSVPYYVSPDTFAVAIFKPSGDQLYKTTFSYPDPTLPVIQITLDAGDLDQAGTYYYQVTKTGGSSVNVRSTVDSFTVSRSLPDGIVPSATAFAAAGYFPIFGSSGQLLQSLLRDNAGVIEYNGVPLGSGSPASTTDVLTGTNTTKFVTSDALAALWEKGSNIASAGTISIGEGGVFHITGTTTITDIDFATDHTGRGSWIIFDGILTLTHNGTTLILPTGANITTAAGDAAYVVSEGSDAVRVLCYQRKDGTALVGGGSMAIGGSITSATAGSVLFAGTSGVLQQDNANIFWDDTNNKLGVGVNSSLAAQIHAKGAASGGVALALQATTQYDDIWRWLDHTGTARAKCYIDGNNAPNLYGPASWTFADSANMYCQIRGNDLSGTVSSLLVRCVVAGKQGIDIELAGSQTADAFRIISSGAAVLTAFDKLGAWKPASMADGSAPNGSVYYSTTASKLVYKDSGGTVNNLY